MVKNKKIRTTSEAIRIARSRIHKNTMLAIHLTRAMAICRIQSVDDDSNMGSKILEEAVNSETEGLIVARNQMHLNSPKPSKEDDEFTKELMKMGRLFGVCVLDHILLNKNSHYSYKENGRVFSRGTTYRISPRHKEYKLICG